MFANALNEDIAMHRSTGRVFVTVCLFAGAALFAPAVLAQAEEDSAAPAADEAAPARATPADQWTSKGPASQWPSSEQVAAPAAPSLTAPVSNPPTRTGPPAEAGLPGWMWAPQAPRVSSGLEWHGNLELDGGYVKYSWAGAFVPESVYDSRGRFVLGPMLTQTLGNDYFLRVTGQVVAWVREIYGIYQINADDVYVQVGKQGLWDFMAGRFLTWRVFRKGLGFDLYTLEDTGALASTDFTNASAFYQHMYEVNTIFMRDSETSGVPAGRAAFHLYPNSWSGVELVGSYGRLNSGANALGGRLAGGINPKYFSLLVGAEYEGWSAPQAFAGCDKCGTERSYGAGGSASVTPLQPIEIALSFAEGKDEKWDSTLAYSSHTTRSWGGYLQLDAGSVLMARSLIAGGSFFRTEDTNQDNDYQRHHQLAAYLAYPLGFNNAVVKLVFSYTTGYQQDHSGEQHHADMYSARLRFAYYY